MPDLIRASDIQADDDTAVVLTGKREHKIEDAITSALEILSQLMVGSAVADMIARWDWVSISAILNQQAVRDTVGAAYTPVSDLYVEAATAEAIEKFGGLIVYDPLASAAPLMAQRQQFIDAVIGQAKTVMQSTILDALRYGIDPKGVQEALKLVIGLTPNQARAVANYRRMLEGNEAGALERMLRDRRFDASVRAALNDNVALSSAKIDTMVQRYAERMLDHRAETIAKTEAMKAATGGIRAAYTQAITNGRLLDSEVRRYWQTARDELVCPVCASIPVMNRQGVGVNDTYLSAAGPILITPVHPRCRCSEKYVTDMSRLQSQPFAAAA